MSNAPSLGPVDYMVAFVAGAVLALLLSTCLGCSVQPSGLAPGASEETSAALSAALATYGPPARAGAPTVQWVTGDPECKGVAFMSDGRCVRGTQNGALLTVATWGGAAVSQTSLAHEALHWYLWVAGVASADHPGDFYERVERANRELWQSGR